MPDPCNATESGRLLKDSAGWKTRRRSLLLGTLAALAIPGACFAQAPAWPAKPVKIVVGYPPGGGADIVARLLGDHLSKSLGQQVIVENRPGAGGMIGAAHVARAEPDGYTLLLGASSEMTIAPATVKSIAYDPEKDLAPVALVGQWPYVLVASPSFAPNTLAELISHAKANSGKVAYSSFGNNTANHLTGESFRAAAGIDVIHVPYKGSGPSMVDVMGGQIQFTFDSPGVVLNPVRAGKLKAIAVTGSQRLPGADNIPTMEEAGLAGVAGGAWMGLMAPAKTPQAIIDRLNADVVRALESPEMRKTLENRSIFPGGGTPDELGRRIRFEIAGWKEAMPRLGIRPE